MQVCNTIDVTTIIQSGKRIFKETWRAYFKYAFLSVLISYIVSIYVGIFDTLFYDNEVVYIIGLILLLLLYFPIVYYSVRITITNVSKFKNIILEKPFDYKKHYEKSKEKFWRVFVVLILKFIIKAVMIGSFMIPAAVTISSLFPEMVDVSLGLPYTIMSFVFSLIVITLGIYLLIRLEFATLTIYWDFETDYSDVKTSFLLTKKNLWSKVKVMIIAHIPGFIMSVISLVYIFSDLQEGAGYIRWIYIGLSLIVNTVFYSWIYAMYYPMMEELRCFDFDKVKTIDEKGREWMSF